jgi:hypothetical protein
MAPPVTVLTTTVTAAVSVTVVSPEVAEAVAVFVVVAPSVIVPVYSQVSRCHH